MSKYAFIVNNQIFEIKEIDDGIYQSWISTGNAKTNSYYPIIFNPAPIVTNDKIAIESFVINSNKTVSNIWTIRSKTPDELRKVWTSYEFLNRFTPQERAAFRSAALTDVNVADFQMLATAAQEVISDDPVTLMGMSYLVSVGLLTEIRKTEILGG